MNYVDLLGYAAGMLIVLSLLPQAVKSWKTKSTKDISFLRYVTYTAGLILMIAYAALINSLPLTVMASIELLLAASILYLKLRYG